MLAKLLSLLIHAKAGAISGVFLLGATGALVSVSAQNGVTTVTIEPSPSATTNLRAPIATRAPEETPSPTPASPALAAPKLADTTACTDEAKAIALQVQRVNGAFSTFHTDLMKLRDVRARATVETADKLLKQVRQAAVKAIHATATATCKKHDDDEDAADTDKDKDEDATDVDNDNDEHGDKAPSTGLTFTGDATSIATQAIAAMQTAFDTAKNAAVTTPKSNHTPEPKKNDDNKKHDGKSSEHHD